MDKIPEQDREFYELCTELILAKGAMKYTAEVYGKNRKFLEKGFTPETNNTMEQLFSIINDFAVHLEVHHGLRASNLFLLMNHRSFNTE